MCPQCEELLAGQEQVYLEEERTRILARVDDLKHRVTELEQQLQETKQEVNTHTLADRLLMKYGVLASILLEQLTLTVRGVEAVSPLSVCRLLTPYLSLGGDGASPAAGREAGREGAGGG